MIMSNKQKQFWKDSVLTYHRWNIATGATRSGKTYLQYFYIPKKIRELKGKEGLAVIAGNTSLTIEKNILEPMRQIWGKKFVGNVTGKNKVKLFGQTFHIVGAEKISAVSKIQGQSIKIMIGDEVATWNKEFFQMVKSRLDKEYSCFYGTCNPDHPNHWFKEFLDSAADINQVHFSLYDNPHLPKSVIKALEQEYEGTVYYGRFILGLWIRAEGVIYKRFSDNPSNYAITKDQLFKKGIQEINLGIDFGGSKSGHAFVAAAILRGYSGICLLASERHFGDIDPDDLGKLFTDFAKKIITLYGKVDFAFCDSAEQVLIRGLKKAAQREKVYVTVKDALKSEINDRIRATTTLIGQGRFYYIEEECQTVKKALQDAVWNDKVLADERLDDGTTDIDSLDGMEYTFERSIRHLIDYRERVN